MNLSYIFISQNWLTILPYTQSTLCSSLNPSKCLLASSTNLWPSHYLLVPSLKLLISGSHCAFHIDSGHFSCYHRSIGSLLFNFCGQMGNWKIVSTSPFLLSSIHGICFWCPARLFAELPSVSVSSRKLYLAESQCYPTILLCVIRFIFPDLECLGCLAVLESIIWLLDKNFPTLSFCKPASHVTLCPI